MGPAQGGGQAQHRGRPDGALRGPPRRGPGSDRRGRRSADGRGGIPCEGCATSPASLLNRTVPDPGNPMAEARRDLKALPSVDGARFLIVEARYYDGIGEMLLAGATRALEAAGAKWDVVNVPGALEIPAAIRMLAKGGAYAGAIALGCVIRGETYHFEIVAGESSRAIMDITVAGPAAGRQRHPDRRERGAGHRARRSGAGRQGRRRRARRDHAASSAQARGACLMGRSPPLSRAPRRRAGALPDGCRRQGRERNPRGIRDRTGSAARSRASNTRRPTSASSATS